MNAKRSTLNFIFCIGLISLLFTGCGGGINDDALVPNIPPIADAGMDRTVNQGQEVFLNGAGSTDSDGQIVSYLWEQTAGAPVPLIGANLVAVRFLAPMTGVREELVFQLTVQDNAGASNSAQVLLTANVPPTADVGPDQFLYASSPVTLTGTAEDVDGLIVDTLWEQTGGIEVVLSDPTKPKIDFIAPSTTGTLTFRYTVTDNDGAKYSDSANVYLSRIIFSDTFDSNHSPSVWGFINDTWSPDAWDVVNGELYQQLKLESGTLVESYHIGTMAYLNSSIFPESRTFRFSADITPRTISKGSDVGVIFPFNLNNYYRLSMNSRSGFTRLEKRDGLNFTTLAVNSIGYVDGKTVTVTIEINTDTIIVIVDSEPVFAKTNLTITPGTIALYSQEMTSFDNVVIAENSPQPLIVISSPLAHSIALEPDEGDTLVAKAVTLNKPVDAAVFFVLNDGIEYQAEFADGMFSATISGVPDGENEISAIIRDANGVELSRDTNTVVGVAGNYIIAVGDSITNGSRDQNPTNNNSLDGRIVATQGFQAPLNDELTLRTGRPHIVFNEGIGGDRSSDLESQRIDAILERHPRAGTMLLLIGTNDVLANIPVGEFESNVRTIANTSLTDVDRVFVALIPPFYNDQQTILNSRVATYNTRIKEIAADPYDNLFLGPDFFALFENNFPNLYDADGVHPNDAGYQEMANAWADVLNTLP